MTEAADGPHNVLSLNVFVRTAPRHVRPSGVAGGPCSRRARPATAHVRGATTQIRTAGSRVRGDNVAELL